jgi:hypothetical protein
MNYNLDFPAKISHKKPVVLMFTQTFCTRLSYRLAQLLVLGLFLSRLSTGLFAQSVTLAWDPNLAPGIVGYRLYSGTSSGVYTQSIEVGNVSSAALSALQVGRSYFFAVTDYNSVGQESAFSNEVSYLVPGATPSPTPKPTSTPVATPTPKPTSSPTAGPAQMISPSPGSKFKSSSVTFNWNAGSATAYALVVGSSPTAVDIYNHGIVHALSATVTNIPSDGRTIFVRLYSQVNNSWVWSSYNYTAFTGSASPTPTASPTPASPKHDLR